MRQKPKPLFVTTAVVGKCRNVTHTLNTCSSHACTPFIYSLSTKYGDTEYYCVDCLDYRNGNTYNCEHVSNYNIINTFASACSFRRQASSTMSVFFTSHLELASPRIYMTRSRYAEVKSLDGGFLPKKRYRKGRSFANTEAVVLIQHRYGDSNIKT